LATLSRSATVSPIRWRRRARNRAAARQSITILKGIDDDGTSKSFICSIQY
jgi:hypothetical protein